jgi:hypothetical protein
MSDEKPGKQLKKEISAQVRGGSQLASIRATDCVFEVWTAQPGFLVVDTTPDGPIGYAAHNSYSHALEAVLAEVHYQSVGQHIPAVNGFAVPAH